MEHTGTGIATLKYIYKFDTIIIENRRYKLHSYMLKKVVSVESGDLKLDSNSEITVFSAPSTTPTFPPPFPRWATHSWFHG